MSRGDSLRITDHDGVVYRLNNGLIVIYFFVKIAMFCSFLS